MNRSRANARQVGRVGLAVLMLIGWSVWGKSSVEQAARLDKDLTPVGAEKAGTRDGKIPAWTGGVVRPIAGYKKGDHHPDPFAKDRPLFTINGDNVAKYTNHLSPGQRALLRKYPSFRMDIYPTRRSAAMPERVYQATKANATHAALGRHGATVTGAIGGIPFPIPANGQEAIWNVLLRFRGEVCRRYPHQATVTAGGHYSLVKTEEDLYYSYYDPKMTPEKLGNVYLYFMQRIFAPARLAGTMLVAHETINQVREPRHIWLYTPGLRRVRRAPYVAYDSQPPSADGLRTFDQFDLFNGAIDRYNWTLVGKYTLYVPYNSYKLHSGDVTYRQIIQPQHINSDLARYELHRVWKLEATLKKGARHIYTRRTFYIDEDSWQPLIIDHYDSRGQIWRVAEGHPINYYEVPVLWTTLEAIYDLQSRRYILMGLNNEGKENDFSFRLSPSDFYPSALRRRGFR